MEDQDQFIEYAENLRDKVHESYRRALELKHGDYSEIEADVTEFFTQNFREFGGLQLYGSRMAGVASDDSDLDIELNFGK